DTDGCTPERRLAKRINPSASVMRSAMVITTKRLMDESEIAIQPIPYSIVKTPPSNMPLLSTDHDPGRKSDVAIDKVANVTNRILEFRPHRLRASSDASKSSLLSCEISSRSIRSS